MTSALRSACGRPLFGRLFTGKGGIMFTIDNPGIYFDVPVDDYFRDCCPDPSLTQSVAKILLDRSPLHAWHAHSRLNPAFVRDEPTKFDIGNVAHALLISRGKNIAVVDAEDWRTKAAKEAREAAAKEGKLGVLRHHYERAAIMATRAHEQLAAAGIQNAFRVGNGEVVIAWKIGEEWARSMIDWLSPDRRTVWDYKTTAASAAPHKLGAKMADDGWPLQAAFHANGLDTLDPENAGRRRHIFVCQETEEPFALTIAEMSESAMTMGRKQLQAAAGVWARCMAAGKWPGYPSAPVRPEYPGWAESRWLDRELTEFADVPVIVNPSTMLTDLSGG